MSYIKQTWANGDVISAAKLNHMEDGIAGAGGVLYVGTTDGHIDKTWQEVYNALDVNTIVIVKGEYQEVYQQEPGIYYDIIISAFYDSEYYRLNGAAGTVYFADTASDYPYPD